MVDNTEVKNLVISEGWLDIPEAILSREGKSFDSSTDIWNLPYATRGNATLDFSKITVDEIRWCLKSYTADRIKRVSTHAGYAAFQDVWREFLRKEWLVEPISTEELKKNKEKQEKFKTQLKTVKSLQTTMA